MVADRKLFAFSPELGINSKDSEDFYPKKSIQKELIGTDYKVVKSFLDMHKVRFTLRYESSNIGGSYITDTESFKLTKAVKWNHKRTELTIFNHSVSQLRGVRMFIRYAMNAGETVDHIYYQAS